MTNSRLIILALLIMLFFSKAFAVEDDHLIYNIFGDATITDQSKILSDEDLEYVGVSLSLLDAGTAESVIRLNFSKDFATLLNKREIELRFSLLDCDGKLITTMPQYLDGPTSFFVAKGYVLRGAITSKRNLDFFQKGVVYTFDQKSR